MNSFQILLLCCIGLLFGFYLGSRWLNIEERRLSLEQDKLRFDKEVYDDTRRDQGLL